MGSLFEDTMKGLLEAVEIKKGNLPLEEKKGMAASTFVVSERANQIVDEVIKIRKEQKLTQKELANKTGSSQQMISRFESKENSPSLNSFLTVIHALGYDVELIKN